MQANALVRFVFLCLKNYPPWFLLPGPPPSPTCQAQKGMWWHITCPISFPAFLFPLLESGWCGAHPHFFKGHPHWPKPWGPALPFPHGLWKYFYFKNIVLFICVGLTYECIYSQYSKIFGENTFTHKDSCINKFAGFSYQPVAPCPLGRRTNWRWRRPSFSATRLQMISKVPADWSSSLRCFGSVLSTFILFFLGGESSHLLFADYIVYDAKTSLMYWMGSRFLQGNPKHDPPWNSQIAPKTPAEPPSNFRKCLSTSTDFLRGWNFTWCSFNWASGRCRKDRNKSRIHHLKWAKSKWIRITVKKSRIRWDGQNNTTIQEAFPPWWDLPPWLNSGAKMATVKVKSSR